MKKLIKYIILSVLVFLLCIIAGSVGLNTDIISEVRLPRVICACLIGASLSMCGVAMQTLLKNPLADGTTLGVSSGASLGAVIALIFTEGLVFPSSILAALLSLLVILALTKRLDPGINTNTIILVGVVFSMFATSLISLLISLFPDSLRSVTFWTMGSLSGVDFSKCIILFAAFIVCGAVMFFKSQELNIMTLGEENASHLGVNINLTKMIILVTVAILIGISVSIAGTIAFVGLIVPHICRFIVGPNVKKLLPASIIFGSIFLMLADLISRTIIIPRELPIGVITSIIGAVVFVFVFFKQRKK